MTETTVFRPDDEHRDEIVRLMAVAFNMSSRLDERAAWLPIQNMRCVSDGDRIVAAAGARDFRQWFGRRELEMSGIWGVVTSPEHRGGGLATRAVTTLLEEARERGQPLSALYPATQRPYRGMGYEQAGTMTRHEVALDDLPHGPSGALPVEEFSLERDLDGVRTCYRASVSGHHGPIDCDDPDWWHEKILGRWFSDDVQRAVVARGPSGIEGYASFTYGPAKGAIDFNFSIQCRHLVATSVEGYASLFSYMRGFRGLGISLRFTGPPAHPLGLLVEEQRVAPVWTYRWMLRLLDVPEALSGRGYPPVSGQLVLAVEDGLFPENRGPWLVEGDGSGSVSVSPARGSRVQPVTIGTLSSVYSGYLSPFDAVALGRLDAAHAPFLAQLYGGPAPWMHDFF
ncbi:MAG TPA: GNAT family N-acetyltransferase [Actinomycetota bacterium]|nr:GNAT family N-acetyltransferase [Actinomycetota bacterium]